MKPLVFVHGYLGGGRQWAGQVAEFSGNFNVVTPDLPGYASNRAIQTPETIGGLARYILGELDRLELDQYHLVGHSMGGMIVQEMVTQAPERVDKLVLYGTGPVGIMPGRFETIDESRAGLMARGVEPNAHRIAATWFMQGEAAEAYPLCAELAIQASQQAALAGLTAMESWSGVAALSMITNSTLVLWGDSDRAYQWPQPEQLWRNIAGAQLGVIPGCSHAVHLEKPALFNAMLGDFLLADS